MKTINWSGYEWIPQERWGQVHHEKLHWWYDASCVSVDSDDNLHLTTRRNPKTFNIDGEQITSIVGVGLVSCTHKFGHGTFSVTAKLPVGANLWPAFWMWSWDSWPPEIDVLEGYSNQKGSYFNPSWKRVFGFWDVQTNLHYTDGTNRHIGGETHWFGFKNPTRHFIKYEVDWDPEYVKFYYDGRLVRTVTDPNILMQLNQTTMNVVVNNGVTAAVDLINPPKSDFTIKSFTYQPKR